MADTTRRWVKTKNSKNPDNLVTGALNATTYGQTAENTNKSITNTSNSIDDEAQKYAINADSVLNDPTKWVGGESTNPLFNYAKSTYATGMQDATDSAKQYNAKANNSLSYANRNIPKEGAYGNYNGLSGDKTEALSRQANAVGQYTFLPGAQIKGTAGNAQDYNPAESIYKFSPIETEETKQREAGRQLWQQQNEYAMGVQNDASTLNYNMYKQTSGKMLNALSQLSQMLGIDAFAAYKNAQYAYLNNSLLQSLQQKANAYIQWLPKAIQTKLYEICRKIPDLTARDELGRTLNLGQFTSEVESLANALLYNIKVANPNATLEEAYNLIYATSMRLCADASSATSSSVNRGFTGASNNGAYAIR